MKLLIYAPLSLRFGGGTQHWIMELIPRLRKFNVSASIICTKSTMNEERISFNKVLQSLKKAAACYFELPYQSFHLGVVYSPFPKFLGIKEISSIMKDSDITYFSNAFAFHDVLLRTLKAINKKPVISGHHGMLFSGLSAHDFYVGTLGRVLLKGFDACHVLNVQDYNFLKRWGIKHVFLIPPGVDTTKFFPRDSSATNKKFRVLFVGRLTFQKGVDLLCDVIRNINRTSLKESVEFLVVGRGRLQPLVQNLSKQHQNVRYIGQINEEALPEIFRDSDIFIMPSRVETFGIVALEALASGLPVIASDITGPRDILFHDKIGTLVQRENVLGMVLALKRYYALWSEHYDEYAEICQRARTKATDTFEWDIITADVYKMLNYLSP